MSRPILALALIALFYAVAFGLRTWQHRRATGSSGFRGLSGRPGSPEWLGGALFAVGVALSALAPLAELAGRAAPLFTPRVGPGLCLTLIGIAATAAAQRSMGASWRIGVDAGERTALVTAGAFAWVRNPIFTCMLATALGLLLVLPNAVALAALVCLFVAVELQVRLVEEPYLLRTHGPGYRDYAARVGRFLPGLGRL